MITKHLQHLFFTSLACAAMLWATQSVAADAGAETGAGNSREDACRMATDKAAFVAHASKPLGSIKSYGLELSGCDCSSKALTISSFDPKTLEPIEIPDGETWSCVVTWTSHYEVGE